MSQDLQNAWDQLQNNFNRQKIDKEAIMQAITRTSSNPLEKLKKGIKNKMRWVAVFFIASFIIMLLTIQNVRTTAVWCFVLVYLGGSWLYMRHQYNNMTGDLTGNVKLTLTTYYNRVKKVLKFEETVGLVIISISGIIGWTLSSLYKGETFKEIFTDPVSLTFFLIFAVGYGALGTYAARKMNEKAFNEYLEQLKTNIDLLNINDID